MRKAIKILLVLFLSTIIVYPNYQMNVSAKESYQTIYDVKSPNQDVNLSKDGDIYYFLLSSQNYNISMDVTKEKFVNVYYYDKIKNSMTISNTVISNATDIDNYLVIASDVLTNNNTGIVVNMNDYIAKTSAKSSIGVYSSSSIISELQSRYGSPFYNKYLSSLTENGKTAMLYETKTLSAINDEGWNILVTMSITMIVGFTGLVSRIVKLLIKTVVRDGIEYAQYGTTLTKYRADVFYVKDVKVGSYYPFRSLKDILGMAYIGNNDYIHYEYKSTRYTDSASFYDNNTAIMRRGIELS